MTVGIVGLGLIGGSFAKAYHEAGEKVLAWNRSRSVYDFAVMSGAVDGELNEESISQCDLVLVTIYPEAAIEYLKRMGPYIGKKPLVIDCCGTKRVVCAACFPLAERYGFTYLGGHPMAGTQYSGFKYARANLYHGAPMVIVPPVYDDIELLERVKELLAPAGFGRISVTTAGTFLRGDAASCTSAHAAGTGTSRTEAIPASMAARFRRTTSSPLAK